MSRWHAPSSRHQSRPIHFQGQSRRSVFVRMKHFRSNRPVLMQQWTSLSKPSWLYWSGLDAVCGSDSDQHFLRSSTLRNPNTDELNKKDEYKCYCTFFLRFNLKKKHLHKNSWAFFIAGFACFRQVIHEYYKHFITCILSVKRALFLSLLVHSWMALAPII